MYQPQAIIAEFQFLLVRLKVPQNIVHPFDYTGISIPSGAIKRGVSVPVAYAIFQISIPSGAIKRCVRSGGLRHISNFNSFWCD